MDKSIFDTLSYLSRKELLDLRIKMNDLLSVNQHLINEHTNKEALYLYKDVTSSYIFQIQFVKFDTVKKSNLYRVYHKPKSLINIDGDAVFANLESIKSLYDAWIQLVEKMHEVTQQYYNPHEDFYNNQFADFFTNDDEDSLSNPFEIDRQEALFCFLSFTEGVINETNDISKDDKIVLLESVNSLKENIPKFTKKKE